MSACLQRPEIIFYDGHCGLCHFAVRFVLKHDGSGTAFRFAPLQGKAFQARCLVDQRFEIFSSMAVRTSDDSFLVRSDAWIHILMRLGGRWKVMGALVGVIPRWLRDGLYNLIAGVRYWVFGTRKDLCPLICPELRDRFDL